ncbi:MAG: pilus assembly protein PilM [Pirellulaceae bacterium]
MASGNAVWGIDIGQCALKALRCTADENGNLVADAYDFIEYPKILSQPEADPDELIREALETFLSRNDVRGDSVAMSVSGQAGLARFFKPPPVDAKVLPDIVKYEARQQIPFALEDVIWDFQQMGGVEVDGFTLDAEVGLFAMKREQVFRSLKPFTDAEVEVDIVQLAPLCIYNYVTKDILGDQPPPEELDPDNPPESIVILAMGTETTDLVITDGSKLWQRSIPLGGNHFTKQLTKELKLTFAKAEHLKRNARDAEDPKKIFQAMRPVFNDLGTEVQRSITYFQSINRQAKIGRVVMLGNAVKLPGLRQFLEKTLDYEILRIDEFQHLSGLSVVSAPAFKENLLSFAVCFGLCLQGVEEAKLSTNLLPREFMTARLVRAKKPWAIASVAVVLLAFVVHYAFAYHASSLVHPDRSSPVYIGNSGQVSLSEIPGAQRRDIRWQDTVSPVSQVDAESKRHLQRDNEQQAELEHVRSVGEEVVGNADRKLLWLELLKALNDALPVDAKSLDPVSKVKRIYHPSERPFTDREELQVEFIESEFYPDLSVWFNEEVARRYHDEQVAAGVVTAPAEGEGQDPALAPQPAVGPDGQPLKPGPNGPGWVIEIKGYHYHNSLNSITAGNGDVVYVRNTLLKNLRDMTVSLPTDPTNPDDPNKTEFTFEELGIGYAIIAETNKVQRNFREPNPEAAVATTGGGSAFDNGENLDGGEEFAPMPVKPAVPAEGEAEVPADFEAPKYEFRVQLCWQEKRLSERLQKRYEEAQAAKMLEEEQAAMAAEQAAQDSESGADGGAAAPAPVEPAPAAPAPVEPAPADPAAVDPAAVDPAAVDPAAPAPTP